MKCKELSIDLTLIQKRFCKVMNINPPQFELLTINKLEELNDLPNSKLIDVIQKSIGEILREKCQE
ncbi:hypothetical protein ES703_88882 [subsurface metagenome]